MITPCKMRLPVENREEMSRRVQEAIFANGGSWNAGQREVLNINDGYLFVGKTLTCASTVEYFNRSTLPEIDYLDFLKKDKPEYFKLDLSDCDPTERKARWEIIKKAIPHHARWSIQTDSPTAHYGEVGLCSRDSPVSDVLEEEITWEYFLDKYVNGIEIKNDATEICPSGSGGSGSSGDCIITVDGKIDATEILEQLVAEPNDPNLQMKTKDARNLFEREQAYADSQVKPEPEQKRIIYIDDRPMSHRMGWKG